MTSDSTTTCSYPWSTTFSRGGSFRKAVNQRAIYCPPAGLTLGFIHGYDFLKRNYSEHVPGANGPPSPATDLQLRAAEWGVYDALTKGEVQPEAASLRGIGFGLAGCLELQFKIR